MDLAIRPATPADIPAITRIYAHAVERGTASFELAPPDEAEMRSRMAGVLDVGLPYIAATDGGALLGYAYAGLYHRRPGYRFTLEDSIYIAPEAQRRGVGRRLLTDLIALSEARGYRQMIAVIGDSGNASSIGLHRAAGFEPIGIYKNVGFKFGRWLDSVLMQRALGPGASTLPDPPKG
jgi:L-amino acid N-acyltransferase YncA